MEYALVKIIIIFGWSRHFHDEMAISCITIYHDYFVVN